MFFEHNFAPALKRQRTANTDIADFGCESDQDVEAAPFANDLCVHKESLNTNNIASTRPAPIVEDYSDKSFPEFLPCTLYTAAMNELGQGAMHSLDKCLNLWREGRFQESMLLDFVTSIAWQSASLAKQLKKPVQDSDESDCELLSEGDLSDLMSSSTSPASSRPATPAFSRMSSSRRPSVMEPVLDQEEIQLALDLVNSTSLLDSTKTTKLACLVQLYPKLFPFFANNGWNVSQKRFTSAPEWSQAKLRLSSALSLAPNKKRKFSCFE